MDLKRRALLILLSGLSGVAAGSAAALFLILLDWATRIREINPELIWGLPVAGFIIGWVFHRHGRDAQPGTNLVLDEIHDPKKVLPWTMAPLIFLGTVLTHLFGGSAGREGTAVQMGASLSDQLGRGFGIRPEERRILLCAGAGAGFGAAIGAPWAGMVFGMEVVHSGRLKFFAAIECLVASMVGYWVAVALKAPHSVFGPIQIPILDLRTVLWVALCGIAFGLAARTFVWLTHAVEFAFKKISYPPLKPFVGGVVIVALFYLTGGYRYAGLGIGVIQESLQTVGSFQDPAWKAVYTALTVGSGFKGGEFIPLVFTGATLGSALGAVVPVAASLLAAVGFAAVFAGAANTPIACSLMAMELFGWHIGVFALVGCFASFYFSGRIGIYRSQKPRR